MVNRRVKYTSRCERQFLGREMRKKPFYVFFKVDTPYERKYAIVEASSKPQAEQLAYEQYGQYNVARVEGEERGKVEVEAWKWKEV